VSQETARGVGDRNPPEHSESGSDTTQRDTSRLDEIERGVARGDTPRTPAIALAGVAVAVAIVFAVACATAFLVYLLA